VAKILLGDFSHREKDLLLRPYKFRLGEMIFHHGDRHADRRAALVKRLAGVWEDHCARAHVPDGGYVLAEYHPWCLTWEPREWRPAWDPECWQVVSGWLETTKRHQSWRVFWEPAIPAGGGE